MLLTRSPRYSPPRRGTFAFDLHALSTPPAFVLSQDQTLREYLTNPVIRVDSNGKWSERSCSELGPRKSAESDSLGVRSSLKANREGTQTCKTTRLSKNEGSNAFVDPGSESSSNS